MAFGHSRRLIPIQEAARYLLVTPAGTSYIPPFLVMPKFPVFPSTLCTFIVFLTPTFLLSLSNYSSAIVYGQTPSDFAFADFLANVPYKTLKVQACLLRL